MRLASRRLLQAGALPLAPRALPRLAFPQIRAISTTSPLGAPRDATARPTWANRTARANPFDPSEPAKTPAAPAAAPEAAPAANAQAAAPATPTPAPLTDAAPFSKSLPTAATRSASSDFVYDATSTTGSIDLAQIIMDDANAFRNQHYGRPQAELRLSPVLGRTVHVNGRVDVATAVTFTNTLAARNKIKFHYHHQKFHERPGLKRKRLHSERWRKKFKKGFSAMVHRVQELKSQGW
jgi:pyruvate/2-oxoglutarate dehydrogenase complex dihydrolipoamide acyltransferase (E2) component